LIGKPNFESLDVFRWLKVGQMKFSKLSKNWDTFAKDTVGEQIIRSADSICANIAEGCGQYNFKDNQLFVEIARGSLYETISWLQLAYARQLINIIDELSPKLNAYLRSLENR